MKDVKLKKIKVVNHYTFTSAQNLIGKLITIKAKHFQKPCSTSLRFRLSLIYMLEKQK